MARAVKAVGSKETPEKSAPQLIGAVEGLTFSPPEFHDLLLHWYRRHARDLPWRGVDDPYATWLSEIMLQQTRVATVEERYEEFLLRFPTLPSLAAAEESEVLALWSGLGYYRRARMLHRAAQFVVRELAGKLPHTATELRSLPGIGDYTAAAIASIAFGESIAVVDGNVERVLLRILGLAEEHTSRARSHVANVAQTLMPPAAIRPRRSNPAGDHNQAMMELGATICTPRSPLCLQCPVVSFCQTRGEHVTVTRPKQQSRIVAYLLRVRKSGTVTEVLLARRAKEAAIMPGMLELPPLPLDSVEDREPVLRLRHSITNTNYYVQIYSENAPGVEPSHHGQHDHQETHPSRELVPSPKPHKTNADLALPLDHEDAPFVTDSISQSEPSLLDQVPAADADLQWFPASRLPRLPLTGLTRKTLQRLRVMPAPMIELE
ncbi:MAG: A/G-specific adenine glycosylase [Acidobacteriota bacterium]